MSKKKEKEKTGEKKIQIHHGQPVTRRDFLSSGLAGSAGFLLMPTIVGMIAKENLAMAADCASSAVSSVLPPCLIFDFSGGMAIAQDTAAWGPGGPGDFLSLSGYNQLGYPANQAPSVAGQLEANPVGGINWHIAGGLNLGLKSVMSAAAQANTSGALIAGQSPDDTNNGPHNFCHLVAKAGLLGSLVTIAGTQSSSSGGNSLPTEDNPSTRPVRIASPNDSLNLINYGRLQTVFANNRAKVTLVNRAIESMSAEKLAKFSAQELPAQVRNVVECGYIKSSDLSSANAGLDPRTDPDVIAVFDVNNGEEMQVATLAFLILNGYSGSAVFQRGGADYHDNSRTSGEAYNRRAGVLIGKALELARRKGKKLFTYAFTDGSVGKGDPDGNAGGRLAWTGDAGQFGSSFFLYYDPAAKRQMRTSQLGAFDKTGGGVIRAFAPFSVDAKALGYAGFLNFLAAGGMHANFAKYIQGTNIFGANLNAAIAFSV
jgi:hypothetical protein